MSFIRTRSPSTLMKYLIKTKNPLPITLCEVTQLITEFPSIVKLITVKPPNKGYRNSGNFRVKIFLLLATPYRSNMHTLYTAIKNFVHNRAYEIFLTTKISRTTVHWEQYKFSCFVLCREVLNVNNMKNIFQFCNNLFILLAQVVSFVERSIILCPYLRVSTLGRFTCVTSIGSTPQI